MKQSLQTVFRIAFCSTWHNVTERICCMRTWKSCSFILWSLRSFIDTLFLGFERYPYGTFNVNKTRQRISFSFFERVCGVGGRNIFFLFVLATMTSLYPTVVSHHENFSHPLIYLLYPEGFQKYFRIHFFLCALNIKCDALGVSASNRIKNQWIITSKKN